MHRLRVVLLLAASLLWAGAASAQEVLVPLDERGRVEVVDAPLAARLGLFRDEYPGFREARLFQAPDASYVLEITLSRDGRLARQRVPLTASEAAELRGRVSAGIARNAPQAGVDPNGRYLLLGQTTLLGLGFYGWAVPYVFGSENAEAVSLYLVTAGGSFFLPYAATGRQPVTYGMANLSRYGTTRGLAHGLLVHRLLAGEEKYECGPDGTSCGLYESNDRAQVTAAMLASAGEGVAGYLWARSEGMTAGTANAIAVGGDFGLLGGLGLAYLAGADDFDGRLPGALGLPATAAGIYGAHRIAGRRDYTWGDADVLYTAGAVGALAGGAAADLLTLEEKPLVAGAMLGAAVGLYLGDRFVRDTDFSVGQATLNRLGTLAGGLVGLGVGGLISLETEDHTPAVTGAAVGALAGYLGTYRGLAPGARSTWPETGPLGWRVQVSPVGVAGLAGAGLRRFGAPLPVLTLSRSF